jgi:uncharacterized membrane protein
MPDKAIRRTSQISSWFAKAALLCAMAFVAYSVYKGTFHEIEPEQLILSVVVLMSVIASCYLFGILVEEKDRR